MAPTAVLRAVSPVSTITSVGRLSSRTWRSTSRPRPSGRFMSRRMTSGSIRASSLRAAAIVGAGTVSKPAWASTSQRSWERFSSSSTTSTRSGSATFPTFPPCMAEPASALGRRQRTRTSEEEALQEVAAEAHQDPALRLRLHPLGDHQDAQLLAERRHRSDQPLLDGLAVHPPHERHVELDHLGLEGGEAGQPRVAGPE